LYVFGIDWGRGEEQERKSNAETLRAQRGEAKIKTQRTLSESTERTEREREKRPAPKGGALLEDEEGLLASGEVV
jgi:hypothetical protein